MAEYIPRSSLDQQKEEPTKERKKLDPVVQSAPQPKKQTTWDKFKSAMISEDSQSLGDYLLFDVMVPAFKQTIQSLVNNAVDMLLFGGSGPRSNNMPANRVSYRSYFDNQRGGYSAPSYANRPRTATYNYEENVFASRGDAEAVFYRMQEIIDRYQVVRVADYLELSDRPSSYVDNNYGWTDLSTVRILRARNGGYYLDLPRPIAIDND